MTDTTTVVTHRIPGFHFAPQVEGSDRTYLANRHRHMFMLIVGWKGNVEFHEAQDWLRAKYEPNTDFGGRTCEAIAKDIGVGMAEAGHCHPAWVEVWEDGENGSRVAFH